MTPYTVSLSCLLTFHRCDLLIPYFPAIPSCQGGPGKSCKLQRFNNFVLKRKWRQAGGSFEAFCDLEPGSATTTETGGVTFFRDLSGFAAAREVTP